MRCLYPAALFCVSLRDGLIALCVACCVTCTLPRHVGQAHAEIPPPETEAKIEAIPRKEKVCMAQSGPIITHVRGSVSAVFYEAVTSLCQHVLSS